MCAIASLPPSRHLIHLEQAAVRIRMIPPRRLRPTVGTLVSSSLGGILAPSADAAALEGLLAAVE